MILYLETGILPTDKDAARQITLSEFQYIVEDQVLYRVESNGTLRIIPQLQTTVPGNTWWYFRGPLE